ncbi:MAG: hypothetical protein ACFFBQ_16995 [Promethearchaeota archaeon]
MDEVEVNFLKDFLSILTFNKQGLHEISLNDRSTIHAIIVITILAILETVFGLFYTVLNSNNIHSELTIHGIISTFSIFEPICKGLFTYLYAEQLHVETTISLIISSFLMFYIVIILFTYILTFFINKLGGEIKPVNCFRIIGLSFIFEIGLLILIDPIRLSTDGTSRPWEIFIFISLILQFMVIFLGIMAVSELTWWKISISITITYFISIILGFIMAGVVIRGIINDLYIYKPGLGIIGFNYWLIKNFWFHRTTFFY